MPADFKTILAEMRQGMFDWTAWRQMHQQIRVLGHFKRQLGADEVKRRQGQVYRRYVKHRQYQREALTRFRAWRETLKPTTHD